MNDSFLTKLLETAQWLLLEPVTSLHLLVVSAVSLALGFLVLRRTTESFGAMNLGLPLALVSYVFGVVALVVGLTVANDFLLPQIPKTVPFPGYAAGVLAAIVLLLAAPLGKVLMKCGYSSMVSAWFSALAVAAIVVFAADFGFTNFGPQMARVIDLKGSVSYRLTATSPVEEIKKRRIGLPVGSEIFTRADSSATLDLGASAYVAVRPLSIVRIRAVGDNATVELDGGRVIGSVKHTAKTKFQIRTPAANTGIVGTDFMVDSDGAKQTIVTVASGRVSVSSARGPGTVEVGAGQATSCANGGAPTAARAANAADLGTINGFKAAVNDAVSKRNKAIEDAM